LIPGWNGAQRLVELVGRGAAFKLLLTGEALTAAQAHEAGLVDELVSGTSALDRALGFTERLAKIAPLALSSIKTVVRASVRSSSKIGAQVARREFEKLWFTVDHREAEAAFAEKRQPSFIGK